MTKSNCHQSRKAICRFCCSRRPGGSAETERPSGVLSAQSCKGPAVADHAQMGIRGQLKIQTQVSRTGKAGWCFGS